MQVKITGKNLDIGAALRAHIENRLFDIAEKYFNGTVSAHVTLEKQRAQFTADCTLHLATGLVLQAHGHDSEAMPSYDKAASHLEKQLRRYKRRLKDHNDSRVSPVRRRAAADYVIASAGEHDVEEPKDLSPVIIAESSADVPELSVGEAVMQLADTAFWQQHNQRRVALIHKSMTTLLSREEAAELEALQVALEQPGGSASCR